MEVKELETRLQKFKRERQAQKSRGLNDYNVMGAIRKLHAEVGMHSNFIYSILDPNGLHYQNNLFVKLFIKYVLKINNFGDNIKVEMEEDADGRRIDFTIKSDQYFIGIEMKIYASDEPNQISDYYKNLIEKAKNISIEKENVKIYYLTLDGKKASLNSHQNKPYTPISFNNEILKWLHESKKQVSNITNLNNAIGYYIDVINLLIGDYKSPISQYEDFFMDQEIYECYEKNKDKIFDLEVKNGFVKAKQKLLQNFYINIFEPVLNNEITYQEYIKDSNGSQVKLVLNSTYNIRLFLNKQENKIKSIKIGLAWINYQGDPKKREKLEKLNVELSNNKEIEKYLKGIEFIENTIPKPTVENLFLSLENNIKKLNDNIINKIKEHINDIKKVLNDNESKSYE